MAPEQWIQSPSSPWVGAAGQSGLPSASQMVRGLRATAHGPDLIELLTPEGELTPDPRFPLEVTGELLRDLYRDMVLVRRIDREATALQRKGELCLWVPLLGQEAAQVGAGRALRPTDMAYPSYREHGVAWCRGVSAQEMLGMYRGVDHCSWNPRERRFHNYTVVIGNQVLNAAGYAMGQRFDGCVGNTDDDRNEATMVFFGDGATSQGDVHEGMVFAASFDAPLVFYCQNNQWAISEPVEKQSRLPLYKRSAGYGIPGLRVDGNDVLACLAVSRWALQECREGNGPIMIEAYTYRMDAHTTADDPTRYRLADEAEHWKLLDPIERVKVHLARNGYADNSYFQDVSVEADELGHQLRSFCLSMPVPPLERMFSKVYAEPNYQLAAQQADFAEYLAALEDM